MLFTRLTIQGHRYTNFSKVVLNVVFHNKFKLCLQMIFTNFVLNFYNMLALNFLEKYNSFDLIQRIIKVVVNNKAILIRKTIKVLHIWAKALFWVLRGWSLCTVLILDSLLHTKIHFALLVVNIGIWILVTHKTKSWLVLRTHFWFRLDAKSYIWSI